MWLYPTLTVCMYTLLDRHLRMPHVQVTVYREPSGQARLPWRHDGRLEGRHGRHRSVLKRLLQNVNIDVHGILFSDIF